MAADAREALLRLWTLVNGPPARAEEAKRWIARLQGAHAAWERAEKAERRRAAGRRGGEGAERRPPSGS